MISVLIETRDSEDELARTLAALVGGVVEGMVREVIVCDAGSTDHTHRVADIAGCAWLASGGVAAGIRQAKGDWLLLLEPGATLVDGWMDPVLRHVSKATIPARFRKARSVRTPFLARLRDGNRALKEGLLIRKAQALALAKDGRDAEGLARGLATKQIDGEIVPAERQGR